MALTEQEYKEQIQQLVNQLDPAHFPTVVGFLQFIALDPVERSLFTAPYDDEPLTAEDLAAIRAGDEAIRRGETIPMDEVLKEFRFLTSRPEGRLQPRLDRPRGRGNAFRHFELSVNPRSSAAQIFSPCSRKNFNKIIEPRINADERRLNSRYFA